MSLELNSGKARLFYHITDLTWVSAFVTSI